MTVELDLSADEQMLQDAVARSLQDASPLQSLARDTEDASTITRHHWALATEMGWPGLLIAELQGGVGLQVRELALLCEEMGRHLFCGPFVATAALGVAIATLAERHGKMPALQVQIASGGIIIAVAAVPPTGMWVAPEPSLTMDNGALSGLREMVEHPAVATHIMALDLVRRGDGSVDFLAALVPTGQGLNLTVRQALDVSCPIASLQFDRHPVEAENVLRVTLSDEEFTSLMRPVHVAVAAELTGVAQAALDGASNHAKTREQFGKPIGSFQAIKHKLADGFVAVSNARLAVRYAASVDEAAATEAARVLAADAALKTTADYIQIQGGMGISWESGAHLHLKRARRLVSAFGDTRAFRHSIADRFVEAVLGEVAGSRSEGSNNNAG